MKNKPSLESKFLKVLRSHLPSNDRSGDPLSAFLVALSGGLDSSALLRLALATAPEHGYAIIAGHVNHGVRPDAFAEEARLRNLCRDLGVPFRCARLRGGSTPRADGPSRAPSEETMRRARTAALRRMAAPYNAWILLGHQREDQAETLLLNLVRGTGLRGLAGMPQRRGIFLRPLLDMPRESLRAYMESIAAPWVEDPTNLDLRFARNRIRHRVLPLLETEVQPRATEALARTAGHLQRALAALEAQAEVCLASSALPSDGDDIRLDPTRLRSYHRGLIEFALRQAVARVRGSTIDIPTSLTAAIADLCVEGRAGRLRLPGGTIVEATDRWIRVSREVPPPATLVPVPVTPAGSISWGAGRVRSRTLEPIGTSRLRVRGLERLQVFDLGRVRFPVTLRAPADGDRLEMEDGKGSRRLSDLLSERGVPRSVRGDQPVLEDAEGILWAPGIRRSARALVGEGTGSVWIVRWFGPLPADRAPKGGAPRG